MKQTIVLLHGWGFDANIWRNFLPYLESKYELVTLDLLGFGKNLSNSKPFSLNGLTEDVLNRSPNNAIYLGWSLGGLIAMNIAIHHPDRITKLITFASTPKFVATENWPGMPPKTLEKFHHAVKMDRQATLQQFLLLQFHGSDTDRATIKALKQQIVKTPPPSEQALSDGLTLLKETDLRDQLHMIQCPQHYLFGRCDTLVPATIADAIKVFTNNAHIELLPKVSHAPFLSNPQACAEKIEAFLG